MANTNNFDLEFAVGKAVSKIVPGNLLLLSKLGKWYEKNSYHKYESGDILILDSRNIYGYGLRPVAVIDNYSIGDTTFGKEGVYTLTMYRDDAGNFFEWMGKNIIPFDVKRTESKDECHFKGNIENQFKKVKVSSIEQALALYESKESLNFKNDIKYNDI
jgi:hypothetical protein